MTSFFKQKQKIAVYVYPKRGVFEDFKLMGLGPE